MAFTNEPGVGLDASGNLLPGYRYATYSNGVGMGTPIKAADAVNTYGMGSFGAQLAGLNSMDYAANANPQQATAQQVMSRGSGATTVGGGMPSQQIQSGPQNQNQMWQIPRNSWNQFYGQAQSPFLGQQYGSYSPYGYGQQFNPYQFQSSSYSRPMRQGSGLLGGRYDYSNGLLNY